jgi:CHASE3 domain sensor protein
MKPIAQRVLAGAEVVPLVRAMSVALVLVMGATFLISALAIRSTLSATVDREAAIRKARVARARVLTLQIDEETGLRGFAATGAPIFLAPFFKGREEWPRRLAELHQRLEAVDPESAVQTVAEGQLNDLWLRTVALPMIQNASLRRSLALHVRGKTIIDSFRQIDGYIYDRQELVAAATDGLAAQSIQRVFFWAIAVGLTVMIVVAGFAVFLVRTLEEMHVARREYEEEKRIADMLQEAFIQKALPDIAAVSLDAVYVPAGMEAQVGGDWYDAFELPDKRILFSIGDVSGHGIGAAIVMSRARQAILSAGMNNEDPAKVLAQANAVLMLQDSIMVTAVCGYIEPWSMKIAYATAGHPPPILASSSAPACILPGFGPPLGATSASSYRTFYEQGAIDSVLVLYTDGLVEYARNVVAGERRLLEVVDGMRSARPANPARHIFESIFGEAHPSDDVAILVASFAGGETRFLPRPAGESTERAPTWRAAGGATVDAFNILVPELRRIALLKSSDYRSQTSVER